MSPRVTGRFWPSLIAGAAALALSGCGGRHEAPPPAEVAPTAAPETTPASTAPAADPAAAQATPPSSVQVKDVTGQPIPPSAAPATRPASVPFVDVTGQPTSPAPPAPAASAAPKPAEQPADPLKWLQDREARAADYKKRLAEAEADLAVATASVADWERTVLAFKNPFLARPKLAAEDATTVQGMNGAERVNWAQSRLDAARAARDTAQTTVNDLKANPPPE